MVDVKVAVEKAKEFARDSLGSDRTIDIRPEEIESSLVNNQPVWLITLSNPLTSAGPLGPMRSVAAALGADTAREYKVFTVKKDNGEVLSMKIRLFATPMK